jgi:hypothetical protein
MMMFGVFTARVPAPDWKPEGWTQTTATTNKMINNSFFIAENL